MYVRVESAVVSGPSVQDVTLEFESTRSGLPGLTLVGLARASVLESKERVFSALRSSGIVLPRVRTTVNLCPVDVPKSGSSLDLPLALGLLQLYGFLPAFSYGAVGELGLDGSLRSSHGLLALIDRLLGRCPGVYSPPFLTTPGLFPAEKIVCQTSLSEMVRCIQGEARSLSYDLLETASFHQRIVPECLEAEPRAFEALSLSLSGGHHLLLYGPPGRGKTHLRQYIPSLLPPLSQDESRELLLARSLGQAVAGDRVVSPHHSATVAGLLGGGVPLRAGAVSHAHNGVLFLDELPEFSREALESLRQPLEDEKIELTRGGQHWVFPASCTVIATANPCPCGYFGEDRCHCVWQTVQEYQRRISGPLIDRFDMHVQIFGRNLIPWDEKKYRELQQHIQRARERQRERAESGYPALNRSYSLSDLQRLGVKFPQEYEHSRLSMRRKLKWARLVLTLADTNDRSIETDDWLTARDWILPEFGEA